QPLAQRLHRPLAEQRGGPAAEVERLQLQRARPPPLLRQEAQLPGDRVQPARDRRIPRDLHREVAVRAAAHAEGDVHVQRAGPHGPPAPRGPARRKCVPGSASPIPCSSSPSRAARSAPGASPAAPPSSSTCFGSPVSARRASASYGERSGSARCPASGLGSGLGGRTTPTPRSSSSTSSTAVTTRAPSLMSWLVPALAAD